MHEITTFKQQNQISAKCTKSNSCLFRKCAVVDSDSVWRFSGPFSGFTLKAQTLNENFHSVFSRSRFTHNRKYTVKIHRIISNFISCILILFWQHPYYTLKTMILQSIFIYIVPQLLTNFQSFKPNIQLNNCWLIALFHTLYKLNWCRIAFNKSNKKSKTITFRKVAAFIVGKKWSHNEVCDSMKKILISNFA